ncbi:MAG: hypothetical protein ACLSHL_09560 [Alistipes communis]
MVLLDGDHVQGDRTLADLKIFLAKARYDANFSIDPRVLESYLDRVGENRKGHRENLPGAHRPL